VFLLLHAQGDEATNHWEDVWYSKLEGSPGLVQIKEERGQELLELVLVSGRIGRKEVSNGNGRGKGGIG
jgi:hypothetical protein